MDDALTQIAESYRGQSWPMPADVAKAFDALPKREQKPDDLLEWARRAWFHGNADTGLPSGSVVPGATSWEIAKRLIDEGADPWALRYAGFETDIGYYRDLEARGHGWSGHAAKMAELAESAACFGAPQ